MLRYTDVPAPLLTDPSAGPLFAGIGAPHEAVRFLAHRAPDPPKEALAEPTRLWPEHDQPGAALARELDKRRYRARAPHQEALDLHPEQVGPLRRGAQSRRHIGRIVEMVVSEAHRH